MSALSRDHQRSVDNTYDALATTWIGEYQRRPDFQARLATVGAAVLNELADESRQVVLDFGGGAGVMSAVASSRAARVVCLDRSWRMLRQAELEPALLATLTNQLGATYRPERVNRIAGDVRSLSSVALGSFDLVIAIAVLEYIGDIETTIASLTRLMAVNGHLLFTVPNPRSMLRKWDTIQRALLEFAARVGPRLRPSLLDYESLRPHGSSVPWSRALQMADLTVLRSRRLSWKLSGVGRLVKPNLLVIASPRLYDTAIRPESPR